MHSKFTHSKLSAPRYIKKRYDWLKRSLNVYDSEHASIFPRDWGVDLCLVRQFVAITLDDYRALRLTDIDIDALYSIIKETTGFERLLDLRFKPPVRCRVIRRLPLAFRLFSSLTCTELWRTLRRM